MAHALSESYLETGTHGPYTPTLDQARDMALHSNLIPVYREVAADLETPVSAYIKLAQGRHSFLLESVEGGERLARYSFIGTQPYLTATFSNGTAELREGRRRRSVPFTNPLDVVRQELGKYSVAVVAGLPRFHGGAVGYLGYELVRYFEGITSSEIDMLGMPEAYLLFADTLLVFDHVRHTIKVVSHVHVDGDLGQCYADAIERIDACVRRLHSPLPTRSFRQQVTTPTQVAELEGDRSATGFGDSAVGQPTFRSNISRKEYGQAVERIRKHIYDGDVIQVVLSQRLQRCTAASPLEIYRALRRINPSPYMYLLELGDVQIIGASPELLVRVEEGAVETHPIAGTRRRGEDYDEDQALEFELREDEKECAEHLMLLDLGRNDIGRVSVPGSVKVTKMMDVERYSHVMHLVSHVEGRLALNVDQYAALQACFPAGTVSGAPKVRAMQIIADLEPTSRGPYAGAVGYFSFSGNLDTAITIRTIVLKDGVAYVQAGGGIVADSEPEREYEETLNKARALFRAIDLAEQGG